MSQLQRACLEILESRQLLSSSLNQQSYATIGDTGGVTASAVNPRTTGVVVDGGTSNAYRDTAINLAIQFGDGGGVKETSLKKGQFQIFEVGNSTALITGNATTSGGGDTLTIKPTTLLKSNTDYRVEFNQRSDLTKITDIANQPFDSATYTFRTGTFYNQGDPNIKFNKSTVASKSTNGSFSAITIGPDGRLYASTLTGHIHRWDINSNGTLAGLKTYTIVRDNNGGAARFITGITFDPRSTSSNPILWVSHGQAKFGDSTQTRADNYTGKISRLTNNFTSYQDVIVNIPRSVKDHLNNQISFDPAGKNLYFVIPSHSAMGRADNTWGNRAEETATAAMFRLALESSGSKVGVEDWLNKYGPINLDPQSRRPYVFTKSTNPLRFYATGIRNAYDMVWHSNGHLYLPTNGSAAGGNTPEDPNQGGTQQLGNVQQTIDDYLYDIEEGGYYGHPNPTRGEYILQGGNPTSGKDAFEVTGYPTGTQPDSNYRGAPFSFGKNQSPDGVIEYQSNAFGGRLKGSLIVARYSSGDDLVTIKPRSDGTFRSTDQKIGTVGFTGFENPLDLVEDTRTGNIYVASLTDHINGGGSIQLLKPQVGQATLSAGRVVVYATSGNPAGSTRTVTITNTASVGVLTIDVSAIRLTGANRKNFLVTGIPTTDIALDPGNSHTFTVKFVAKAGDTATKYGNLAIATDDNRGTYTATVVQLRGVSVVPPGRKAAPATIGDTGGVTASAARPVINVGPNNAYFNAVRGKTSDYIFRIKNVGAARLDLKPGALTIRGENRSNFEIVDFPSQGVSIVPGRTVYVTIRFKAFSGQGQTLDIKTATLRIASSDPRRPVRFAQLRGLPTAGEGGSLEPSLQKIFNLFNLPIKTGQTDTENFLFPYNPSQPNDEVVVQQLVKAGPGAVTIKPLAVFGNDSDPAVRMGYYIPGILDSEKYLWYTPGSTAQSVAPLAFGQTSFDPGEQAFGLVTEFPNFVNADASVRKVYSEDQLNATWDANSRKMRFYAYKDQNGKVVPNTYVVAEEEFTSAYDNNDLIYVVTNVKPAAPAPVLSYKNTGGYPANDWMVFNKIQTPDALVGNVQRTRNTLRLRNAGQTDLIVTAKVTGDYAIESGGGTNFVIKPGEKRDIVIRFTATSGRNVHKGALTLTTNDPNQPTVPITLAGYWQETSEFDANRRSVEPTAEVIINQLFGYTTSIKPAGKTLNNQGRVERIGDEILASYFKAADENAQVRVVELATFHGMTYENANGDTVATQSFIGWHQKGSPTTINNIFTDELAVGQMALPYEKGTTVVASGQFNPRGKEFGFVVEKREYTDPKLNSTETGKGHFMRLFPAYSSKGNLIPNTYIVLHDYNTTSVNFDFNDNIYLISNIIPSGKVKPAKTFSAERTSGGPRLTWTSPIDGPKIAGYNIYRSTDARQFYTKLNDTLLDATSVNTFVDSTAVRKRYYFYQVKAVDVNGQESQPLMVELRG